MNRIYSASLWVGAVLAPWQGAHAASQIERVKAEYPRAAARLEATLSRASGTARLSVDSKRKKEEVEAAFAVDGESRRVSVKPVDPDDSVRPFEQVHSKGPAGAFSLTKKQAGGPYAVTDFGGGDKLESNLTRYCDQFLLAPCGVSGEPMSKLLASSAFKITDAYDAKVDGQDLIRINFRRSLGDGRNSVGAVFVAPQEGWRIRRCETRLETSPEPLNVYEVVYSGLDSNVPQRVVWAMPGPWTCTATLADVSTGPTPEKGFTLAAYGLDAAGLATPASRADHTTLYLIGFAACALASSLYVKFAARRIEGRGLARL